MIVPKIDKNRMLVMDADLESMNIDKEQWKAIMRIVLGRHYDNIQKQGSGWSFPLHTRDVFETHLKNLTSPFIEKSPPSPSPSIEKKKTVEFSTQTIVESIVSPSVETKKTVDSSTQTIVETIVSSSSSPCNVSVPTKSGYKYDIDPGLAQFRQQWLSKLKS